MLSRPAGFSKEINPITRSAWLAWGLLVFIVPFLLQYDYLLNTFYHFGGPYPDGGVLAHLMWHSSWRFLPPDTYVNYSFFAIHFTPFLMFVGELSNLLPTHMIEFYSGYVAAQYAALGLALFYAFSGCVNARRHWQMALLALVAIGFSFNDIVMDGVCLAHFEYVIPLGIFLFLWSYARENWRAAIFFFIFTMLQREDAGFHLFGVMTLLILVKLWELRSLRAVKRDILVAGAAFAYSAAASLWIWYLNHAMGRTESTFSLVYSGVPPYAHLAWPLFAGRLATMFHEHIYLWLGALVTLVWAIRTRDLYLLVGFAANIPWFILSLTAFNDGTGVMYAYYAYPFVLSLGWPLIAAAWRYGFPIPRDAVRKAVTLQALLVIAGLLMWNTDEKELEFGPLFGARWGAYELQEAAVNRQLVRDFVMKFDAGAGDLGTVMADWGVQCLLAGTYHGKDVLQWTTKEPFDTLVYMYPKDYWQPIQEQAQKNHLTHHYCMPGTTICMFTKRSAPQLGLLSPLMVETPPKGPQ